VITPRRTRLIRVADLHGFRRAIASLESAIANLQSAIIVVPTGGAARQLRRTLAHDRGALVTREELYDCFHRRLASAPRRLTALERDVIAQAAARTAAARSAQLSFQLRPGLVAEMLRFYDHLRRQSQQVSRFEELIDQALGGDELDRGAARMRTQTRFLADAFREYERRVSESGGCDEHVLRERLMSEAAADPIRHVVVSVPDWIADPAGLYSADFDLLTRVPGLESLDIVCTEAVLRTGFHERLHNWWPGLEEVVGADPSVGPGRTHGPAPTSTRPVLVTPRGAPVEEPWWTVRDREEELVAIARQIKADERRGDAVPPSRTAIVFKGPLPYLYLAAEVFGAAGIPYEAFDALPFAAEPTVAALDLVLDAISANFTRATLVALLRSPHFVFSADGVPITREATSALDRALSGARYLGDPERLDALSPSPALQVARDAARELMPLATARPASEQFRLLRQFWTSHLRPIDDSDRLAPRETRARAAVADMLLALEAVHAAHDDPEWAIREIALAVRRWIEEHTFAPSAVPASVPPATSVPGGTILPPGTEVAQGTEVDAPPDVQLLDDQAARYGLFDDVSIVGVVDQEWPERPRRNIFYPPSLLKSLGWPSEKDRRSAADARFLDLLGSASRRTQVFTFTLDEDAIVSRSMQLDEIPRARLSTIAREPSGDARVFVDEALSLEPVAVDRLDGEARSWADLRTTRSPAAAPDFHGTVATGPGDGTSPLPARVWSVSALETYLDCPFKFFAQHVLRLEEEPDDEEVMDPRRQGQFVHEVFERFFGSWQKAGHRGITPGNLDLARQMFTDVVDGALERLPAAEAGLERTRLLGSSAAAGLGEAVFRMEAERPVAVVERLLEKRLEGEFTVATANGPRVVSLRGKADRVDLLEDGTFRLIDYKLGWPPNRARALQLPIYSVCAEQRLAPHRGRNWTLGEAAYLAFKGPRRVVPLFASSADRVKVLADAQQRLVDTLDAIATGEFPPKPDDVYRCETCSFAAVCRKDYVGEL
jgi:ATP-dependent helicase/nuclease subunit B